MTRFARVAALVALVLLPFAALDGALAAGGLEHRAEAARSLAWMAMLAVGAVVTWRIHASGRARG